MKIINLLTGVLVVICFSLLTGCSSNDDKLFPTSSDISFKIKQEGVWAVGEVAVAGIDPDKIEECGIEWSILPEEGQIRIGDKDQTMKAEGGKLNYTFRIFPWSHFLADVYNNKCKISVTPYARVFGQVIKGYSDTQRVETGTKVHLWTHKSEIVDTYYIRFHGQFEKSDRIRIEECGIYWSEEESSDLNDYNKCVSRDRSPDFTVTVKDVVYLDKVYVVGYVKTPDGTFYSKISQAYIPGSKVTISIDSEVKDPTFERITVSGNCTVENPAAYPVTERGFCYFPYSNGASPTVNDNKITVEPGIGDFTGTITGLKPFTYYSIRAYAICNGYVSYSNRINTYTLYAYTFTPNISLKVAGVDPNRQRWVLLEGKVINDYGYMVTERGFCYNTYGKSPTIDDDKIIAEGTGLGTYQAELNLSPGKYFFKTYAINQAGIRYSSDYKEVIVK